MTCKDKAEDVTALWVMLLYDAASNAEILT